MPQPTLPSLSLATSLPKNTDVLILGLAENAGRAELVGGDAAFARAAMKTFGVALPELVSSLGGDAHAETVTVLPAVDGTRVIVVGLGEGAAAPETVRMAVGAAARKAVRIGDRIAVALGSDDPEMLQAVGEGALLGSYTFAKISGKQPREQRGEVTLLVAKATREAKAAVERATAIANNVCLARDWVNTPANLLYPETFAKDAASVARDAKISVEILDERQLVAQGFGGILAVGNGSERKPRLVRLSYSPRGATFHLGLVGKGITFDTGGINLKPADGMYTMKCDMGGAAAILAATRAIAQLGLKIKVTAYAAMAENMPSGSAYRPSDVLTMYGGKTVENANSDAEGRLVMADALVRLGEDKPDLMIDVATLTGACMVALGMRCAGVMSPDDETADRILDAAEAAGEEFWQLPMPDYIRESLSSKVADVKSSGKRQGGAMAAAAFLEKFVPADTAWAHLDIAGPAFNDESEFGYVPNGGTGYAVRTLVALAQQLAD